MPRPGLLLATFVIALMVSALWMLPASPFVSRLDGISLGGRALVIEDVAGRLWNGRGRWRWHTYEGQTDWRWHWRGLAPGIDLTVNSSGAALTGWVTVRPGTLAARDISLRVPLDEVTRDLAIGQGDGLVLGEISSLEVGMDRISAEGNLRYSGGKVTWPPDGHATLPPLRGQIQTRETVVAFDVVDPDDVRLIEGELSPVVGAIRIFRAYAKLLGVSQGGADDDVVFEASEQFQPAP